MHGHRALDKCHMPPCRSSQMDCVVVRHASEQKSILRQLVPLLTGDLACLTSDAQRGVREKALARPHLQLPSLVSMALNPCFDSGLWRAIGKSRFLILGAFLH